MDPFSAIPQPDEGYSEAPLNPSEAEELKSILNDRNTPHNIRAWLEAHPDVLPKDRSRVVLTLKLLGDLPTSVISEIAKSLYPRLHMNFVTYLPDEIVLKILGWLDPVSLINVAQACRGWYDVALDRKLWERLYHLEGWQVMWDQIQICEDNVNQEKSALMQMHRIQTGDGQTSKVRAVPTADDDLEMTDGEMTNSATTTEGTPSVSVFGSPASSFSSSRPPWSGQGLDASLSRGASTSSDTRGKRKQPGGDIVTSLPSINTPPPILPEQDPRYLQKSALWMWDAKQSKYRLNWKHLYSLRSRLENNWDGGKYTNFQLPHPDYPSEGHDECVYAIQFDSNWLVSGSRDRTTRIWNLKTQRLARPPLKGHTGSVLCLQFDAHPEEDLLVTGSSDSNVFIWKFSTGELIQKLTHAHTESVLNVRFDKRILVTSSKDNSIKIFNRRDLRYGDLGYGKSDEAFALSQSVKHPDYEPDLAMEMPVKSAFTQIGQLVGHNAAVNAVQVKDRTVVSVSGDRQIKIWNWPDQVCTKTIPAHQKGIACVEFDGRRIVSGSSDCDVFIFDAVQGVAVAQLCGHQNLVRTLQAGFADLPYSEHEDPLEAKRVETAAAHYRRAHGLNEIPHTSRSRRTRRINAGSSKPEDIQTIGSLLPPGGGGSKRYARIVSGSYDQQVIVWRRNKNEEWKPHLHLRQEEAQAQARAAQPLRRMTNAAVMVHAGHNSQARSQFRALLAQGLSQGPAGLRQVLIANPGLLAHHDRIQREIDRQDSHIARGQLRGAVADAILVVSNEQAQQAQNSAASAPQAPGSSLAPQAQSGTTSGSGSGSSNGAPPQTPNLGNAYLSLTGTQSNTGSGSSQTARPPPTIAEGTPIAQPGQGAQQGQQGRQQGAATAGPANQQQQQQHPHIPNDQGPARIFKLQFDARKIICCSQAPVIVGWDFCNGDQELEDASRLFATVS